MKRRGMCATCRKGPRIIMYRLPRGHSCSTCYQGRKYGRIRRFPGTVCACGCGRPARSMSGFAAKCYQALWNRTRKFQRLTGSPLSLDTTWKALQEVRPEALALTPTQGAAVRALKRLLTLVLTGDVVLAKASSRDRVRSAKGFVSSWRRPPIPAPTPGVEAAG